MSRAPRPPAPPSATPIVGRARKLPKGFRGLIQRLERAPRRKAGRAVRKFMQKARMHDDEADHALAMSAFPVAGLGLSDDDLGEAAHVAAGDPTILRALGVQSGEDDGIAALVQSMAGGRAFSGRRGSGVANVDGRNWYHIGTSAAGAAAAADVTTLVQNLPTYRNAALYFIPEAGLGATAIKGIGKGPNLTPVPLGLNGILFKPADADAMFGAADSSPYSGVNLGLVRQALKVTVAVADASKVYNIYLLADAEESTIEDGEDY